jgi:hypothetical protein
MTAPIGTSHGCRDGAGRTITLSDFGFHVDDGRLCLHDVELTGGRNVPALVFALLRRSTAALPE